MKLKKLNEQVVVITGASSGIGLATARMAAERGAKLVLAARNDQALRELTDEINGKGGEAVFVTADVGNEQDVAAISRAAVDRFGGFDTWINNAGIGMYGEMLNTPIEDHRKLFETNFWGVVYGSLEAARHLKHRTGDFGGTIINIGSEVSDRAVVLIGMYSASKHAVQGFTDALRMELEAAKAPICVTLVKPSATNTPFPEHAQNHMEEEPQLPSPIYDPEIVAKVILHCAEHPERSVFTSGAGKKTALLGAAVPRLTDWMMEKVYTKEQKSGQPPNREDDALYRPTTGLRERGRHQGHVRKSSVYAQASLHPLRTSALFVGAGLAIGVALRAANSMGALRR